MLPDKQCMIDILKFISENNQVKVVDGSYHNISLGSLSVSNFLKDMSAKTEYDMDTIAYNFMQCYNHGLVEAKFNYKDSKTIMASTSTIYYVTVKGVNFIN